MTANVTTQAERKARLGRAPGGVVAGLVPATSNIFAHFPPSPACGEGMATPVDAIEIFWEVYADKP